MEDMIRGGIEADACSSGPNFTQELESLIGDGVRLDFEEMEVDESSVTP